MTRVVALTPLTGEYIMDALGVWSWFASGGDSGLVSCCDRGLVRK